MNAKRFVLYFAAVFVAAIYILARFGETPHIQIDAAAVNDTVKTLAENWLSLQRGGALPSFEHQLDYAVIDNAGNLVAATRRGLSENLNAAILNRDIIVDITVNGKAAGKAIFYNDARQLFEENRTRFIRDTALVFAALMAGSAAYAFYLHVTLVRPFKKMKDFAGRIAAGNFDVPLEMDRDNVFGAFTESFDIMREELHKAKENERRAERSKKELVASLSHDIKTPVASIKAVTEVMTVMANDDETKRQLEIIGAKAEQINVLISDLFQATLEELQAFSVNVTEVQSTELIGIIKNSDYKGQVRPFSIPSCIISADLQRLRQVIDNIIINSYKYANTDIEIEAAFEEHCLLVSVVDYGAGVPKQELPLLFGKFYRGKSAEVKSGYGLGLYISKYLMEQMAGGIRCENRADGFAVQLRIRLS